MLMLIADDVAAGVADVLETVDMVILDGIELLMLLGKPLCAARKEREDCLPAVRVTEKDYPLERNKVASARASDR